MRKYVLKLLVCIAFLSIITVAVDSKAYAAELLGRVVLDAPSLFPNCSINRFYFGSNSTMSCFDGCHGGFRYRINVYQPAGNKIRTIESSCAINGELGYKWTDINATAEGVDTVVELEILDSNLYGFVPYGAYNKTTTVDDVECKYQPRSGIGDDINSQVKKISDTKYQIGVKLYSIGECGLNHVWFQEYREPSTCGNSNIENGEDCDDGNFSNNDACRNDCKWNVCGDTYVRTGVEACEKNGLNRYGDDCSYGERNCCYTASNPNPVLRCSLYDGPYCGDGNRDILNEECDGEYGCNADCTWMNSPWFRTQNGDLYSSNGVTQRPSSLVSSNARMFSSYMCYNKSGIFTVGGGCFNENVSDSHPTSLFAKRFDNDLAIENKTNEEFEKLKSRLTNFTNGQTYINDGSTITFFNTLTEIPTMPDRVSDNRIVYLTENLSIDKNIKYSELCPNQKSCSLMIVVDGNVEIKANVENIDAFVIASGKIVVESEY